MFSIVKKKTNCLILTDSRGGGLSEYLNSQSYEEINTNSVEQEVEIDVITIPGAKIQELARCIPAKIHEKPYELIIIIAGICNFTTKEGKLLTYGESQKETVLEIIQDLRDTYPHAILTFATIPPASLKKNARFLNDTHNFSFTAQQDLLIKDIKEVNNFIVEQNIIEDSPTLDWARPTFITSKKRKRKGKTARKVTKFTDRHLPDGVHPNEQLKTRWFKITHKFIVRKLAPTEERGTDATSHSGSSTDSDSDSSEKDYGNFKRRNITVLI